MKRTWTWKNTHVLILNPSWNRYLTVCQTVGRCQGCSSRDTDMPSHQHLLGGNRLTLVMKARGLLHSDVERVRACACTGGLSPAYPTPLQHSSAIPANKEQPSFQELGTSVVCLQGTHCANSLKIIPSKLIKMLHLLTLQYKQAERRKKKWRH